MKAKSFIGVLLALMMVLTMTVLAPAAGAENSAETIDQQIGLLFTKIAEQKQAGQMQWYYSVTDLDHDGHLELVAAAQHIGVRPLGDEWRVEGGAPVIRCVHL